MKLDPVHGPALGLAVVVALTPAPAAAYVGPGLGAGAMAAVVGVVGSLFLGLFAVIYYPIKRALRGRRRAVKPEPPNAVAGSPAGDSH